jgi:threonine/homoserine/homoserine lactone efflux protein
MPAWTAISLFLLAALGLLFIPGPAVLFVVTRSVDQGRQAGVVSALGIGVADLVHTTAAAFGLSALLLTSALAFTVVKYIGAAYLIYQGSIHIARKRCYTTSKGPHPQFFLHGLMITDQASTSSAVCDADTQQSAREGSSYA